MGMDRPRKRFLPVAAASVVVLGWAVPAPAPAQSLSAMAGEAEELDALFVELKSPDTRDWESVEQRIIRHWTHSGSASADLLLQRGQEALEAGEFEAAIEHFSALIDHAPEFAEAWNGRATAFYMVDEYGLAIDDVAHVLALNPRHFGALAGLGTMLEEMGDTKNALAAYRMAAALNPHRESLQQAIGRLQGQLGESTL